MRQLDLPGLDRLLTSCRRLGLDIKTTPPRDSPPEAGVWVEGIPLDPLLASFYARFGQVVLATRAAGMGLFQWDDSVNRLEVENHRWRELWQPRLPVPLFVFGGTTGMAYFYATVPGLADESGRQPVVEVDTYEEPYALPIASDVDQFFYTYARYLEALLADPGYAEYGSAALSFPWRVPEILAQDERLVELLRAGRFDSLLKDEEVRAWVGQVLQAAR
jgi:hypothetical protein